MSKNVARRMRLPAPNAKLYGHIANVLLDKCSEGAHFGELAGRRSGELGYLLLDLRRRIAPALCQRVFPAAHITPALKALVRTASWRHKRNNHEAGYALAGRHTALGEERRNVVNSPLPLTVS